MAIASPTRIDDRLRAVAVEALTGPEVSNPASDPVWARLRELGTELWLDTGNLSDAKELWKGEFTALTTNNTLANQVVQTGVLDDVVRETVSDLKDTGLTEDEMVMELGFVVNCHIALRLVKAFGAMVSVELHPAVSEDIDLSIFYAQRYYAVCPERFYIKIPLTPEGYCAVARVRAMNIPVNFTLGFSARQNYLAAAISNPTFCNVFLGRLNAVMSENALGDGKFVGEKACIATQAAVRDLRDAGQCTTRLIAASLRSPSQIADLAGVDLYTMPPKVAKEFLAAAPNPAAINSKLTADYPIDFGPDANPTQWQVLWKIDGTVKSMAAELKRRGNLILTGDDLRQADTDFGTGLFHRFTGLEISDIKTKGKIPDLFRWGPAIGIDTLMTESALQSFAVDQAALDDHLRALLRAI